MLSLAASVMHYKFNGDLLLLSLLKFVYVDTEQHSDTERGKKGKCWRQGEI
jgi:hypothetical protein